MNTPVSVGDDLGERTALHLQSIMSEHLSVDSDGDIQGLGPASYAMAREAVSMMATVTAERDALDQKLAGIETCACSYDAPGDVCAHHSPALMAAEAQLKAAREALERKQDMLETLVSFVHRWTWRKEGNGTSDRERLEVIKHYPPIAALNPKAPS